MKYLILILAVLLLVGCKTEKPVVVMPDCDKLLDDFDRIHSGDKTCFDDSTVGATLINTSSRYVEYSSGIAENEYVYELKFKGRNQIFDAKFYTPEEVDVPLKIGRVYSFQFNKACGAITSMGPHNGMFPFKDISMFKEVKC